MKIKKDWWLQLSCFLIGYDYGILKERSALSKKKALTYSSALIILIILWSLIGFLFAQRYVGLESWWQAILVSLGLVIVVIQIERQIINSNIKKWYYPASLFRMVIAFIMATIGSLILDQIFFKDDIETARIEEINNEVKRLLPGRIDLIETQIKEKDSEIVVKNDEINKLELQINKEGRRVRDYVGETVILNEPIIDTLTAKPIIDTLTGKPITKSVTKRVYNYKQIGNPKITERENIKKEKENLQNIRVDLQIRIQNEESILREEITNKKGFLTELTTMFFKILFPNTIALIAWLFFLFLFLFLELFILVSKLSQNDKTDDYEEYLKFQKDTQIQRLRLLQNKNRE